MCQIVMWLNRWTGHKTNQHIISNDNQMHFQQCEIMVHISILARKYQSTYESTRNTILGSIQTQKQQTLSILMRTHLNKLHANILSGINFAVWFVQ